MAKSRGSWRTKDEIRMGLSFSCSGLEAGSDTGKLIPRILYQQEEGVE
jgi:hypothetical protein